MISMYCFHNTDFYWITPDRRSGEYLSFNYQVLGQMVSITSCRTCDEEVCRLSVSIECSLVTRRNESTT